MHLLLLAKAVLHLNGHQRAALEWPPTTNPLSLETIHMYES